MVVLLTDGLPNRVPTPAAGGSQEDTVLAVAAELKAAGIRLYTIGVGRPDAPELADRINPDLLRAAASGPELYFEAPDAEDLARIYGEVAGSEAILSLVSLGCGVGIVPRLVADQSPLKSSLSVLDVEPRLQPFRVGVCTEKKKLKSPVVKAFWESMEHGSA